ncbi:MAG: ExbD/TolR family protein [Thermoanaerobaculia bacterium]
MGAQSGFDFRSDINIAPLVDVTLVLLIIFMVLTPLLQMGYDVKVPPKSNVPNDAPPPDQLIVSLTAQNRIFLNKEEMNEQTLALRLTEILKNRASKTVFFSGDDAANYSQVIKVMDIVRNAGATNLGIVLEAVPVETQ